MEDEGPVLTGTADAVRAPRRASSTRRASSRSRQTTRHDVIAFLTHVEELAGEPARWLHLGMTSSDVLDTALAILTRDALGLILGGRRSLRAACRAAPASTRPRR